MKQVSPYAAFAALGISLSTFSAPFAHAVEAPVKQHGIAAADVKKVVPKEVLAVMDPLTTDSTQPFYQSQERDGKTYYTVHYTKADKRMFVRVTDKGKLVVGPMESFSTVKNEANPDVGKDPNKPIGKREKVTRETLPPAVIKTVDETTAGGKSFGYQKQTVGSEVTYVIDWTKDGDDTNERLAADGKVIEASPLAVGNAPKAPETAANSAAPAAPGTAAPATPAAPAGPTQAELDALALTKATAERDAALANARYQIFSAPSSLPDVVHTAIEKEAPAGSIDLVLQRFKDDDGTNLYTAHWTTPKGARQFMAVDQAGQVVIEPRKSVAQKGGKGVRYEVLSGDKLPPAVLKEVQANGGTDFLILARTAAKGDKDYYVQYADAKGERMESEFNDNGKEKGKPRAAREEPGAILEKKAKAKKGKK